MEQDAYPIRRHSPPLREGTNVCVRRHRDMFSDAHQVFALALGTLSRVLHPEMQHP